MPHLGANRAATQAEHATGTDPIARHRVRRALPWPLERRGRVVGNAEPSTFGELRRRYRTAAGLTQEELAERAGLSARGVSDLERRIRRMPHPETTRRLAEALGLGDGERTELVRAVGRAGSPGSSVLVPRPAPTPPMPLTSFVGRQAELAEVDHLLSNARLLTLTGAGGVGKTRLALEVARRLTGDFPDGASFVELAGSRSPSQTTSRRTRAGRSFASAPTASFAVMTSPSTSVPAPPPSSTPPITVTSAASLFLPSDTPMHWKVMAMSSRHR